MNSVELMEKKQMLKDEAVALISKAKEEIRMLNDIESNRYNEIKSEISNINEEIRALNVEIPETINNQINTKETKNNTHTSMNNNFSLLRSIRNVVDNKSQNAIDQAVIDNGANEMRHAGISYNGQIQLPLSQEFRTITVATEHDDTVAVDTMDVLTALHGKSTLIQSGVKTLFGLKGDVKYPVMSAANSYWCDETGDCSTSTPSFSSISLTPHRISCIIPVSKGFLVQDTISAEAAIRQEIINSINSTLESTILGTAAATTNKPGGLFYGTVNDVSTFKGLCDMEASIETLNLDNFSYICTPKAKAALRGLNKGGNVAASVWSNGEIDGTKCLTTTNIGVEKGIICADWSQMVLAQFGSLDILVDPYTLAGQGIVKIVANAYFDFKPLRDNCYAVRKLA